MTTTAPGLAGPIKAAAPPFLHRLVAAGHLRYWVIASWALALATEVALWQAGLWFAVTMAVGFIRGAVDQRMSGSDWPHRHRLKLAVATLSCVAWAAAPLLAWHEGSTYGAMLAAVLICAGYTLVFTQMRANPREALIVSLPYMLVTAVLILNLWGHPGFLTLIAAAPVLGSALLIKVIITQLKDGELHAVAEQQRQLIAELEVARDQANAANEAKSNFLGVMSHELRTPLNGVLGAAQLLASAPIGPREQAFVSIIHDSGEHLLALLNNILDVTKIEAGRSDLELVDIATDELTREVVGAFRVQAEAKGLSFVVETESPLPAAVRTDPLGVRRILHNLLDNAIKFTEAGEIRLVIRSEPFGGDQVRLGFAIHDSGAGIAEGDLACLFQPFSQVDASSTRRFGGTGLGLTIARRLANRLGGEISVSSTLLRGSCFELTFPADIAAPVAMAPLAEDDVDAEAEAGSEPGPLRVLIVEDHPVNRLVLESWLRSAGHSCALAENGEAALAQAAIEAFDLILMDVNMPVLDGLGATRRLRSTTGPNQNAPIVILSASARTQDHASGLDAGADAYLDKPVDFTRLAEIMWLAAAGREAFAPAAVRAVAQ